MILYVLLPFSSHICHFQLVSGSSLGTFFRPFADDFQRLALRGALQQQRRRRGAAAVGVPILGAVLVDEVPGGWISWEVSQNAGSPWIPKSPLACKWLQYLV